MGPTRVSNRVARIREGKASEIAGEGMGPIRVSNRIGDFGGGGRRGSRGSLSEFRDNDFFYFIISFSYRRNRRTAKKNLRRRSQRGGRLGNCPRAVPGRLHETQD